MQPEGSIRKLSRGSPVPDDLERQSSRGLANGHFQRLVSAPGPAAGRFVLLREFFEEDTVLLEKVRSWEAGEVDTLFLDSEQTAVAAGALPAHLPAAMRGKPIFQCFLEDVDSGRKRLSQAFPTVVYSDAQCVAFIPAGFRGDAENDEAAFAEFQATDGSKLAQQQLVNSLSLTPLTINPASFNHGHGAALMSLVHVLVIPRRRIYNAVTLKESDVGLVHHLQKVGHVAVRALLRADGRDGNGRVTALSKVVSQLEPCNFACSFVLPTSKPTASASPHLGAELSCRA